LIEAMPRPRWPHLLREVSRHGTARWVVRIGHGPRTPITAAYGSPEFEARYHAAVRGEAAPGPRKPGAGTLQWLWDRYRDSSAWAQLSPATRRQRENIMASVLKNAAGMPVSELTRKALVRGREDRKATPAQANNFIKLMRGLCKWAADAEHIASDPARDVGMLKVKTAGFPSWTETDIERFEARWPIGTRERVAFDVLLYTGLRRGDAVRLGRQHVRDGVFRIKTEKTGAEVIAPVLPPLEQSLAAGPTGDLHFIVGERGQPMTKESFGNWFGDVCKAAGVRKSAHGLRKAGAARAATAGATTAQLKAIFGWTDEKMPSLYTESADRERLARDAMSKLERNNPSTSIPNLDTKVGNGDKKTRKNNKITS
jgi:integrase